MTKNLFYGTANSQTRIASDGTVSQAANDPYWTPNGCGSTGVLTNDAASILAVVYPAGSASDKIVWSFNGTADNGNCSGNDGSGNTTYNQYIRDGEMITGETIIVPYTNAVTRQLLEGYLAHKWGLEDSLPGGHPYKSEAP